MEEWEILSNWKTEKEISEAIQWLETTTKKSHLTWLGILLKDVGFSDTEKRETNDLDTWVQVSSLRLDRTRIEFLSVKNNNNIDTATFHAQGQEFLLTSSRGWNVDRWVAGGFHAETAKEKLEENLP